MESLRFVDSLAWRVVRRWRALVERLGLTPPAEAEYDRVCDIAGALLEQAPVVRWVSSAFPIALLDEAQDLTAERLRIVRALAAGLDLLAAADEFQCLDEELRPNPFCTWITVAARIVTLEVPRRTQVPGLLSAAAALRAGRAPLPAQHFSIKVTPAIPLAGTVASNQVGWYRRGGKVAIVTPSAGHFATGVVD